MEIDHLLVINSILSVATAVFMFLDGQVYSGAPFPSSACAHASPATLHVRITPSRIHIRVCHDSSLPNNADMCLSREFVILSPKVLSFDLNLNMLAPSE